MKKVVAGILTVMIALSSTAFADILVIANRDVPEDTLSIKEIQEIFLGKRVQWRDNSRIRFTTVGDAEVHRMFLKQYVNLSESDWKIYWKRMVFTGRGMPPETIATEAELIDFVAKTKGAVGYLSSEGIPKKPEKDRIKIISVR
jgi:ABC-type phosphate transport system substrate-binding protein